MTSGHVRDGFPWVRLNLPGRVGLVGIEFIVDTGFAGELAVPLSVLQQLDVTLTPARQLIRLAGGAMGRTALYEILLDWNGEPRPTASDGTP